MMFALAIILLKLKTPWPRIHFWQCSCAPPERIFAAWIFLRLHSALLYTQELHYPLLGIMGA